jgi:hypothetical protein
LDPFKIFQIPLSQNKNSITAVKEIMQSENVALPNFQKSRSGCECVDMKKLLKGED